MKPETNHGSVGHERSASGHSLLLRVCVLALLFLTLAGCSNGDTEVKERASEEVAALGDALAESVILSYQANQGRAEPDAGTNAVNEARTLTLSLSETSASLDTEAQALSLGLIELANRAIVWVGQREYELAEKLRLEEFIPAAEQFNSVLAASGTEPAAHAEASAWSTGKAIGALSVIALIGVLVFVRYRRGDIPDPVVEARKRKAERSGQSLPPKERKWSDITPLVLDPIPDAAPSDEGDDSNRPTKARTMEVDLRKLLMTALYQIKDYGWDMSIVCPEMTITADPVKMRQAVLGALGTAFRSGAQRVGIVVEDIDGDVLLTIGRDAPQEQADAERSAERFTTQVKQALGADDLESSLISDDDVSLISVSLGRKAGADELSERVV